MIHEQATLFALNQSGALSQITGINGYYFDSNSQYYLSNPMEYDSHQFNNEAIYGEHQTLIWFYFLNSIKPK